MRIFTDSVLFKICILNVNNYFYVSIMIQTNIRLNESFANFNFLLNF